MPPQARIGDKAFIPVDAHGCLACPHPAIGPGIFGSANVLTNARPSMRVNDPGIHAVCCGPNMWSAKTGSATVLINGRSAHRMGDQTRHCGGTGTMMEGSPNVMVGDLTRAGAGLGASGGAPSPGPATAPPPPAPAASPAPPAAPEPEHRTPKQAPAAWALVYSDGAPVRGFRSQLQRAAQKEAELYPDGQGRNQITGMDEDEPFGVGFVGTQTVRGKVLDPEGRPAARAQIRIVRAFGPELETETDAGGAFSAPGLVEDEPLEVEIRSHGTTIEGRFTDERGAPVPVESALWLERRRLVTVAREDGRYRIPERAAGESYELLFVAPRLAAAGRFVDADGRPIPGVYVRARLTGGRTVLAVTDADGAYRIPSVMPQETYSLEILSRPA